MKSSDAETDFKPIIIIFIVIIVTASETNVQPIKFTHLGPCGSTELISTNIPIPEKYYEIGLLLCLDKA